MWRYKLALGPVPYTYGSMTVTDILRCLTRAQWFMSYVPGRIRMRSIMFLLQHAYLFTDQELHEKLTEYFEWIYEGDSFVDILDYVTID